MFSKVISYCRFCSFQGHVNVIDDQYARDFSYDGPEFIWKYIIITILIRVYLPIYKMRNLYNFATEDFSTTPL
jgi:hypothetical protein